MKKDMDIFDRIMALRILRPLQPFYRKYKELLLYLFFGGLAFFLSIGLFWAFTVPLGIIRHGDVSFVRIQTQ